MSSSGDQCFSGGVDGTIQSWNTPSPNIDPYDSYGTTPTLRRPSQSSFCPITALVSVLLQRPPSCGGRCAATRTPCGVWSTVRLTGASSPLRLTGRSGCGTPPTSLRLWRFSTKTEVRECPVQFLTQFGPKSVLRSLCGSVSDLGVATSADLVSSDPAYMVTSFDSGHIGLFNMETQQLVLKLDSAGPPGRTTEPGRVRIGKSGTSMVLSAGVTGTVWLSSAGSC